MPPLPRSPVLLLLALSPCLLAASCTQRGAIQRLAAGTAAVEIDTRAAPIPVRVERGAVSVVLVQGTNGGRPSSFQALLGPTPDPDETLAQSTVDAGGTALVIVESGFAYLAGNRPYGGTSGGTGIEPGSGFIVFKDYEASAGVVVDRFVYVLQTDAASQLRVDSAAGATVLVSQPFFYVDILAGGTISAPQPLPILPNGDFDLTQKINLWVDYVIHLARQHGLDAPSTADWP